MGILKEMRLLYLLSIYVQAQNSEWRPVLPQFNTGRLYMQKTSKWHNGRLGPVCNGPRRYRLTEEFFQWVCIENGFERVDFFGNKTSYLENIQSMYGNKVYSYFESLY